MKVVLHKSTDGVLHESAKLCAAHNVELRVSPAVEKLVEETAKFPCEGGVFDTDEHGTPCLYVKDVSKWVAANHVALRKLLNDALIVKRPRKAKKPPVVPASISGLTLVAAG